MKRAGSISATLFCVIMCVIVMKLDLKVNHILGAMHVISRRAVADGKTLVLDFVFKNVKESLLFRVSSIPGKP